MKKVILIFATLLTISCKTQEWSKETIKAKCLEGAKNEMYNDKTTKRANEICDCVAEKTFSKFKTEDDADQKFLDVVYINNDCRDAFDKEIATQDSLFYEQNPDLKYMKQE